MNRTLLLAALSVVAVTAGGCVERRIHITSDPPGAAVTLNDVDVGRTPVEIDFTYFGTYDVRLRLDGYEPLVTARPVNAPFHEQPGIDFIALLIPVTKRTHVDWHFTLEPADDDVNALISRAEAARESGAGTRE